jgi:hypothetical protein
MWALGFARKGKIVSENTNQFSSHFFFIGKFSAKFNLKSMIFSITK